MRNRLKRTLCGILAFCMLLALLPAQAVLAIGADGPASDDEPERAEVTFQGETEAETSEAEPELAESEEPAPSTADDSGSSGITWSYDAAACVLTVSGSGGMENYSSASNTPPWYQHMGSIKELRVEDGITSLGSCAFYGAAALETVRLPDSLSAIGAYAFQGCTRLTGVVLPESVSSIGVRAFQNCANLASINYPLSWSECPTSWIDAEYRSEIFRGCSSLTEFTVPEGVTKIPDYAFQGAAALKTVHFPASLTAVGSFAFKRCGLTAVDLPTVKTIGSSAFADCTALQTINTRDLQTIGGYAFQGCTRLTGVVLPESVSSIGVRAFQNCTNLASINYPLSWSECPTSWIDAEYRSEIFRGCSSLTEFTVPEGVTKIPDYAFQGAAALKTVHFPASLTAVGSFAFKRCGLTAVDLPTVKTIGSSAFADCTALQTINTRDLQTIGGYAFQGCTRLTEVVLPESVSSIGVRAFQNCANLASINYPRSLKECPKSWISAANRSEIFRGCSRLTEITVPEGVTAIPDYAFNGCDNFLYIEIPPSVTSIGVNSFTRVNSNLAVKCRLDSYAYEYAVSKGLDVIPYTVDCCTITVLIPPEQGSGEGAPVTEGITIQWYDDTGAMIGSGFTLTGVDAEKTYAYQIILGDALLQNYEQPARGEIPPGSSAQIKVTLLERQKVDVSVSLQDEGEKALEGASVVFVQTVGGKRIEVPAQSAGGRYFASIANVPTIGRYSLEGYYSGTFSVIQEQVTETTLTLAPVILTKTPADRIHLTLSLQNAASPGEKPAVSTITSFANLAFTISHAGAVLPSDAYTVQYPYIYFQEGTVQGNDQISIHAADQKGNMTGPPVQAALDENRTGEAALQFVQNGRFSVGSVDGTGDTRLMVFHENGDYLWNDVFTSSYVSAPLPEGTYKLAFLQKTGLLSRVERLEELDAMGVPYASGTAAIQAGVVTAIPDVQVPALEAEALYYTAADRTGFHSNALTAPQGRYVQFHLTYAIDSKYETERETVVLEFPRHLALNGGVVLNGKSAISAASGGTVRIPANVSSGTLNFCANTVERGECGVSAYLEFMYKGETIRQPIGTVSIEVTDSLFYAQETTSVPSVYVSGVTIPGSAVQVYANGEMKAEAKANRLGDWECSVPLTPETNFVHYDVYALITPPSGGKIQTETKEVIYKKGYLEVSKITMINTAHNAVSLRPVEYVTVFDFTSFGAAARKPNYWYWPSYPTFTFKLEFNQPSEAALEEVDKVYVSTRNSAGDETLVPLQYDSVSKLWVGKHNFSSNDVPVSVAGSFTRKYNGGSPQDMWQDYLNMLNGQFEELAENKVLWHVKGEPQACVIELKSFADAAEKEAWVASFPNTLPLDGGGVLYYRQSDEIFSCVDEAPGGLNYCVMEFVDDSMEQENGSASLFCSDCGCREKIDNAKTIEELGEALLNCVGVRETDQTVGDVYDRVKDALEEAGWSKKMAMVSVSGDAIDKAQTLVDTNPLQVSLNLGFSGLMNKVTSGLPNAAATNADTANKRKADAKNQHDSACECKDKNPDSPPADGRREQTPRRSTTPTHDPSGYIYEAVPSNRLEGVKVSVYQSEREDGVGGVFWSAGDYGQENPLWSDVNGQYAWFVPQGWWQVQVTKEGYQDSVTGWLPVPPPQLEVNIGMVSTQKPEVEEVIAYSDRVEILFSQYMNIASVQNSVSLTCGGERAAITVAPLNAESNYDGTARYATRFAVTAAGLSGTLSVSVAHAKNYANNEMAEAYSSELEAAGIRPAGIGAPESISAALHGDSAVTVTLQPGIAGSELTVETLTPSLLEADKKVVTGEGGNALIHLKGKLPGSGLLRVTEPVSGVNQLVSVQIADAAETPELVSKAELVANDPTKVRITTAIPSLTSCETVVAAHYDGSTGKMTAVLTGSMTDGIASFNKEVGIGWVLFFLNDKLMPLCEKATVS